MPIDDKVICAEQGKLYRDIYRYFRKNRFSKEDSEDNTQETFVRYLHIDTEMVRSPKAYLLSIARNLTIEIANKKNIPSSLQDFPPTPPLQEAILEFRQKQERLKEILQQLSPRSREVFLLHRTKNFTYQDIADHLGISLKTVEHHIAKALAHIRKKL